MTYKLGEMNGIDHPGCPHCHTFQQLNSMIDHRSHPLVYLHADMFNLIVSGKVQ